MAFRLNGRALADALQLELKAKVHELGLRPTLGVILVGDDPASHLYVRRKEQAAREVGIAVEKILLPATTSTADVINVVDKFNARPDIHGILVQLPLPQGVDTEAVISAITPAKDADGFHPQNLVALDKGLPTAMVPGVVEGILKLIDLAGQPLTSRQALIIANSHEFARPLRQALKTRGLKVQVSNQITPHVTLNADVLIVALGQPGCLKGEHIKDGAIVIDVGTTKVGGVLKGDVAAETVAERNIFLTPVPGGVGPMTVAMLLMNVYRLSLRTTEVTQRS